MKTIDEWEILQIGRIYDFQYGEGNIIPTLGGKYPVYGSNGIVGTHNKYNSEDAPVIGHIGAYAGIVNWAEGKHFVTYNGVICKIKPGINPYFGYYILSLQDFRLKANVGSQPFVSYEMLKKIKIRIPNIQEQKAIVSVIEKWDKYIELLDLKIQTKKNIKKYLQQVLLTGKVRLEGLKAEWQEYQLGEVCKILKGRGLSKGLLDENCNQECILYGELYTKYSEIIDTVVSHTNIQEGIKSISGDVLIPASTTTNALDVATASCIKKSDVLLGGDINIFRPESNIDGKFLAQYLSHAKKIEMAKLAQGITIIHLYGKDVKKLKIQIPHIEEQKAISSILSKADEEIAMLEKQKDIIEEQRKYLLNNLVTGEIRLPKFRNNK